MLLLWRQWQNACRHCDKFVEEFGKADGLQHKVMEYVTIKADDDDSMDSDEDECDGQ